MGMIYSTKEVWPVWFKGTTFLKVSDMRGVGEKSGRKVNSSVMNLEI